MAVYVDLLFINNTLMTLVIVWAVGQILDYKTSWPGLIAASLVGSVYSVLIVYLTRFQWNHFLSLIFYIGLNLAVVYTMSRLAFGLGSNRKRVKTIFWIYGLSFLVLGLLFSLDYLMGPSLQLTTGSPYLAVLVGSFLLFLLGKLCWRFFQTRLLAEDLIHFVEIVICNKRVKIQGLVDTGNRLEDPFSAWPVLIVEIEAVKELFPEQVVSKLFPSLPTTGPEMIEIFEQTKYKDKIRILPFSDLGKEHGILPGLKPDKVVIHTQDEKKIVEEIIIGLTEKKLDERSNFQALVPPGIVN